MSADTATPPLKQLFFRYNENVIVSITNRPCPFEFKDKYPNFAVAYRKDGGKLVGCFGKKDENNLIIQWNKGDTSEFPANVFQTIEQLKQNDQPVTEI